MLFAFMFVFGILFAELIETMIFLKMLAPQNLTVV